MSAEIEFTNYRTEKREEIQIMAKIIQSMPEEFTKRESDLLLRSFIVLVYAYWESCYHRVQDVVFEKFQDLMIDKLPFAIKNKIYLGFVYSRAGVNKTKLLRDVADYKVFQNMSLGILENKESKLSEHDTQMIKDSIIVRRGNPNFQDLQTFMKDFNVRIDKIIGNNISEGYLVPYFLDFLKFIIKQRNAIAHKNEKIQYKGNTFNTYFECLDFVTEEYSESYNTQINLSPADFVKEMLFQIDSVFTILIESVEEKRRELNENDSKNN